MDSGIAWSYNRESDRIADLVIEGVDQHRGWFQSLLLTATALTVRISHTFNTFEFF